MSAQGSQKENNGEAGDDSTGMPAADVKFLIECLKNTTGGTISVDMIAVAEALDYKNHRSVGNRILALKKKYNLPISTAKGGAKAAGAGDEPPSTPKAEPTKNKVTKRQAPTKAKKAAAKKIKSEVKKEIKSEDDGEDADIEAEDAGEASSEKSRHDMTADEELDMLARTDSENEEDKYES